MWFKKSRRIAGLAAIALFLGAGSAVANQCVAYEHANYGGRVLTFNDGDLVDNLGRLWRDRISSARVQQGCRLVLHERGQLRGAGLTVERDAAYVGAAWNDRARSASCECARGGGYGRGRDDDFARQESFGGGSPGNFGPGSIWVGRGDYPRPRRNAAACIAFKHVDFQGSGGWRAFADGDRGARLGRRLRDEVSSVIVAPGCFAILDIGQPYRILVDDDVARFGAGIDDRARSLSCECR